MVSRTSSAVEDADPDATEPVCDKAEAGRDRRDESEGESTSVEEVFTATASPPPPD